MPVTFTNAYQVNFNSGTGVYTLVDGSAGGQVNPVNAGSVTVADDDNSLSGAGDTLTSTGSVAGAGTYVGTTTLGNGATGFIMEVGGNYFFVTDTTLNANLSSGNAAISTPNANNPTPVCFYPGTIIATPTGERAVETLKTGNEVLTADGRVMAINWLGRQTVSTIFADPLRVLPIRVKAGALGNGLPLRDLLVSPDHALFVEGVLANAGALVNGVTIIRERNVPQTFTYYHIETAEHALVLAEGVAAETFVDNVDRMRFDNWDERAALPYGDRIVEMSYPRAKSARQLPASLRQRLEDVACIVDVSAA